MEFKILIIGCCQLVDYIVMSATWSRRQLLDVGDRIKIFMPRQHRCCRLFDKCS